MFGYSYPELKDGRIVEEIGLDEGVAALTFRPVKTATYIGRESPALWATGRPSPESRP
jgi:hypothetical protein